MLLERVKLDLCSKELWALLCLFRDVTNGLEIKQCLTEHRIVNATILNASRLVSRFHVLCAVNKACLEEERGTMKAKTLNMQIIHSLGSTTNKSKTLQEFSVSEDTKALLVVMVEHTEQLSEQELGEIGLLISGVNVSMDELTNITDVCNVKKYYDITDDELSWSSLEDAVVTRMAVRDVK